MKLPVYLDHNATTPVDPVVLERMLPFFREHFGNPSSKGHAYGWAAEEAVTQAREQVAELLGAAPEEIVFTGGATESINTAVKGAAEVYGRRGRHVVTVQTEHPAVLGACRALERRGFRVTYLPVAPDGRVTPEAVAEALTDETILVAVMWANNETGVLHPVEEIGSVVRAHGALFLCDATQAVGKVPVSVEHVDLLACSAHKFYGPKGVGALFVRRGRRPVRLTPLLDGGSQEGGRRAGTLNVPGIVGMGAAAVRARELLPEETRRLQGLRDRMEAAFCAALPDVVVNGAEAPRLPQTASITFRGVRAADLIARLRTLALSTGSACASGSSRPSHVLKALGLSDEDAAATLRFSLGRFTTDEEVRYAVGQVVAAVQALRGEAAGVAR
ncbi:MAG: cysteine desulfurase IscS [Rhodothermaceae bacterium]|nr:MAG: cysteine desulfurase IscS [Rhodothermaceae bacterium]